MLHRRNGHLPLEGLLILLPLLRLLVVLGRVKGEIPRQHQGDVRSRPPGLDVRIEEEEYRVDELFLLGVAVPSEQDEAERHDVVELLPEGRGFVGRHVFAH
jgi:hypothetical protein